MFKKSFSGARKSGSSGFRGGAGRGGYHGSFRGGSRGGSRGGFRGGGNRGKTEAINFARFINKVQVTEEIEVFKPEHQFQDFKIVENFMEEAQDTIEKYKHRLVSPYKYLKIHSKKRAKLYKSEASFRITMKEAKA